MSPNDPSERGPSAIGPLVNPTIAHRVHDLKNQLTVMAGCVDALAGQLSEIQALSDLADLQRALGRAFLLATDVLGSDAALSTERSAINVNHVIVDIERTLRRILGPAIECTVSLHATSPFVFAHPLDIERILLNVILNAKEAMGDHGHLTIETALGPIAPGTPTIPPLARTLVRLTVSDTGLGIAPSVQTQMMREAAFAAKLRRPGLGLGSANETVHQLHGRLHVQTQEGVGTRIHVDLPLAT
jgi:signal transduction histidine kinase